MGAGDSSRNRSVRQNRRCDPLPGLALDSVLSFEAEQLISLRDGSVRQVVQSLRCTYRTCTDFVYSLPFYPLAFAFVSHAAVLSRASLATGCPSSGPRRSFRLSTKRPQPGSRFQTGLILWLLVFPCQGVQIWQQSFIQGQPVFTTNSVPPVQDARDLQPVRAPNSPVVEPVVRAAPQALRTICVYRHQSEGQPTVLLADDRMHGRLLHRMICSAFGLADSEWCLRRLVEALPSLPPEQYVLSPVALSWDKVLVPVDLRPLGGRVRLQFANRCAACGEVAASAIQTQRLGPCPVTLCRTSQGWFHPTARLLLLPFGDAFQVWPMHQAPTAELRSPADNDDRAPTLEDRFSTSLSLPSTGELAYHDLSRANAVILHMHGHTYACVPSYADHLTLRSAALDAVAADLQIQPAGRLCFARLLPPLDRMPAIQYVAAYCRDDEVMGVVDLRPSEGGVHVIAVPDGATPAARITMAVNIHGEPAANSPLAASLASSTGTPSGARCRSLCPLDCCTTGTYCCSKAA